MSSDQTDEEIILLHTNGDQEAFKNLINRYTTPLYNFTARLAGRDNAPDIVQEIFIKAWKNISRFDSLKASFKTWIFTIAKNATTDFLRRRRSLSFTDLGQDEDLNSFAENIPDENILPEEVLQKLEDKEILNDTLKKLSGEENEILVLHYQEEMTFDEIGAVLNKSLNTIKSKHRRTLIKLRKILS